MTDPSRPATKARPFRSDGCGNVRVPLLPRDRIRDTVGLPPTATAAADELTRRLAELTADPAFREAVEVASPQLARALEDAARGQASLRALRRTAASLTRYQLRAASRTTPFGLFAAVGQVVFTPGGGDSSLDLAAARRTKQVRPDGAWLTARVREFEADPSLHGGLHVVVNDLVRGQVGRLVIPVTAGAEPGAPSRRTLRLTRAVREVMVLAREPVIVDTLVDRLRLALPGAGEDRSRRLVVELIALGVLLTELQPSLHGPDPLRHVARRLPPGRLSAAAGRVDALGAALARYAQRPVGAGVRALHEANRCAGLAGAVQVDTTLEGVLTLPRTVAEDLEQAAAVLWRLAPPDERLADYHGAFLDRYGAGASVPLLDLLDPASGLGPPPGYRWPPGASDHQYAPARGEAHGRLVARLASLGAQSRARELELDDELLDLCGAPATGPAPRPGQSVELFARLVADSFEAIGRGDYQLVLPRHAATSRAGTALGRFGHALPHVCRMPAAVPDGAVPLQLTHAVMADRMANIARTPLLSVDHAAIGSYPHAGPGAVLRAEDIEVGADARHFRLVSRSLGRDVEPFVPHLLNRREGLANPVRFLLEALALGHPQWLPWDWGALEQAPYLPALRRGRVVLSPERWRLTAAELPQDRPGGHVWRSGLLAWQRRWGVPDVVRVGTDDQLLALDLAATEHQELLQEELRRTPGGLDVLADPHGPATDAGWLRGPEGTYEAEIIVPLFAAPGVTARTAQAAQPVRRPVPPRHRSPEPRLPGGDWLYARLACAPEEQDELLTGPLAALAREWDQHAVTWFFVRYPEPWPHLRLRCQGAPEVLADAVLPGLREVCTQRFRAGLGAELELATYQPETRRYGGTSALPLAEAVFANDSRVVLDALRATRRHDRCLSAATGLVRMARAFHGSTGSGSTGSGSAWAGSAGARRTGFGSTGVEGPEWARWLAAFRTSPPPDRGAAGRRHRDARAALSVALEPAGAEQDESWRQTLTRYGEHLRSRPSADAAVPPEHCLESLMHMHCNRLLGVDREAERYAHALAGDVARAYLGRLRAHS